MSARCTDSRCGHAPYHDGACLIDEVRNAILEMTGSMVPNPSPEALALATSILAEKSKPGEWIDGLPTEPGRYHLALQVHSGGDWIVTPPTERGGSVYQLACDSKLHAIKHMPAPPLPEPPS